VTWLHERGALTVPVEPPAQVKIAEEKGENLVYRFESAVVDETLHWNTLRALVYQVVHRPPRWVPSATTYCFPLPWLSLPRRTRWFFLPPSVQATLSQYLAPNSGTDTSDPVILLSADVFRWSNRKATSVTVGGADIVKVVGSVGPGLAPLIHVLSKSHAERKQVDKRGHRRMFRVYDVIS
jgi:hypothetical protein